MANETLTVTIEQAAKMLGIGRSLAYDMAHAGELPGIRKLRTRFVVSRNELERYIDGDHAVAASSESAEGE